MGLKDAAAKNFFGRPDILAELVDCVQFDGMRVLRDSRLTDLCGEHPRIVRAKGGRYKTDNRYRDKLFECDTGEVVVSISVEYQSRNDRKMIPRTMDYNARLFNVEIDSDGHIRRVMNLVLSFDTSRNRAPCELVQMLDTGNSIFDRYFFNYGYVSLNIYEIAKKLDIFPCGELRDVLYLFKCSRSGGQCMEEMANGSLGQFRRMSRDAAFVCAVFLGIELDIDDDIEEIDMCKMVREYTIKCRNEGLSEGLAQGRSEGIIKGREIGLKEGERNAFRMIVTRLLKQSRSILEICNLTGVSEEDVREIALSLES